jgi:hypothetical protein
MDLSHPYTDLPLIPQHCILKVVSLAHLTELIM